MQPILQKVPGFQLSRHFDLHLPTSTMEGGQHRYQGEMLGKPLLNTDWKVLLTTDNGGRLPLLIEGRVFAGRVFVFGGSLADPDLVKWQGYPDFIKALLAQAQPIAVPTVAGNVADLKLSIPLQQKGGDVQIHVTNPTAQPISGVLAVKIRNLMSVLRNSATKEITVPGNQSLVVTFPASEPELRTDVAPRSSDEAAPFLRVHAGLSSPSRDQIVVEATALVDTASAVSVKIRSEDVRKFPEQDFWPAGGYSFLDGSGLPLGRYVWFTGDTPKLTVHVRNALHNIAPLASAVDEQWPENPTIQGLNDGSVSYGDIRDHLPLFAYWAGRSAATQKLTLTWPDPVYIAGSRLMVQSDYRFWNRANPRQIHLTTRHGDEVTPGFEAENATYDFWSREDLLQPRIATQSELLLSGLNAGASLEPKPFRSHKTLKDTATNSAIGEWEILGWPSAELPPAVRGKLIVILHDLTGDTRTVLLEQDIALDPLTGTDVAVSIPPRQSFGQVNVIAQFLPESGEPLVSSQPLLFVPKDGDHLLSRQELGEAEIGLLCSPGFVAMDGFGTGAKSDTQGWGGPDDKVWAWQYGLMEISGQSKESAQRFFLSPVGLSHYTNPWREFPSGRYVWDWATDQLLEMFETGRWKGKKSLHIVLSDRWNGIPINNNFDWPDFVSFDEHLRSQGKPGLQGRTRKDIIAEIQTQYADEYQRYHLERYAEAMLATQRRFEEKGLKFTAETHGSFPLVGGELGEKLGRTHKAVGTDLFWELRDEDLYKAIGYRFGVVAANPDFESGSYNQWGWVSATQANRTWFTPSGEVEPSRRQWYATYWAGRLTSDGTFKPYSVYGFSSQGGFGVKNMPEDWEQFNRVQSTMIRVRPERATGFGLVSSWQLQESRMTPKAGKLGFGLYTGEGEEQVDALTGELYHRLVKNGVPISFVASTHTLKKWEESQPLVVVDGFQTSSWEIAELDRLNRGGSPIIAIGGGDVPGTPEAARLFGVQREGSQWSASAGTETVANSRGQPFAFIHRGEGRAPTLFCPIPIKDLTSADSQLLSALSLKLAGNPLQLPPGITATTFLNGQSLFLALGAQGDDAREIEISVKPSLLDPTMDGQSFRVIDMDRADVVPAKWENDQLKFQIPIGANDGRMIQILKTPQAS